MVYGCYSRSCGLRLVSILCYLEDWLGEEKNPRTNQVTVYVRELKALLFPLLSLHIEAFSRELKRKEALILVLEYLQPWMNWFYIHQNLWSWPKAWLALNYFGLIWGPWLVLSIFSFAFAHSSGVFQYSLPWKLIKEKKSLQFCLLVNVGNWALWQVGSEPSFPCSYTCETCFFWLRHLKKKSVYISAKTVLSYFPLFLLHPLLTLSFLLPFHFILWLLWITFSSYFKH